ncbi:helix-turn-helix transcriptional regulator [Streptomyces sp. NPDC059828]|uniref:helix-turn-helix domain-containing protein n=1 Tax=Streptomyces sp. NPDC059828 TaxID=3346965 RepID=UPI0036670EBA
MPLSARERDILRAAADGIAYRKLASEWGIAEVTVRVYAHRLLDKLGAKSIAHAVFLACRAGILDGQPQRHGDHPGYMAHVRRGEDPWACTKGCPEGERAYRAERRRARREAKAAAA